MSREAMQMALEALVQLDGIDTETECVTIDVDDVITAIKEALAQPEQEPVAWMHNFIDGGISIGKKPTDLNRHPDRWTALYKDPTPCKTCQALAMAVMNDQTYHEKVTPKREWQGLTKEEIAQGPQEVLPALYGRWGWAEREAFEAVVAWAEAKLKEKNNG